MKKSMMAIAMAVFASLSGQMAFAQYAAPAGYAGSTRSVTHVYDSYYAADEEAKSPSDVAAPSEEPADGACCTNGGCSNDDVCCQPDCGAACEDEPFALFSCCLFDRLGITMAGWTAQSFTWNPDNPADRFNGPVTWTDRSNDYQLNQQYLYIERATDTGGDGMDLGFRVDTLFGTDSRFTSATGLEVDAGGVPDWNRTYRFYGLSLPQFYGEVAFNDLKVKVGHFLSPVGYFAIPTTANFFNTLPYTFQYGEPFTHTGFLASYQMTEDVAVGAGMTRGWDNFDGVGNPNVGYLGTMAFSNVLVEGDSVAIVHVAGSEPVAAQPNSDGFEQRFLQTFVYSAPVAENLNWVFQSDYGFQNNALATGEDANWYGLNNYLFYTMNDKWTWGLNFEWFRDEDGARVGGFLAPRADGSLRGLSTARSGFVGNFYQVTCGPQWRPNGNLLIRPNARWDWYSGSSSAAGTGGLLPYDDGTDAQQFILGTDVVLTY